MPCRITAYLTAHIFEEEVAKAMPNIKSSAKRDQIAKVRNARNKVQKSALKTALKKFNAAVEEGNKETAVSTYQVAVRAVDKAAGKNLIHKNNAANKKSKMARKLNSMA